MGGIIKDKCKVGYLTTIEQDNDKLYKCSCVCGNTIFTTKSKLHNRKIKHCGCLESENVIFNDKNFIGYFTKFKKRRIKDGIEFDDTVTPEFLWNLLNLKQDNNCALTGLPLSFNGSYKPSIDRINSKKGYHPYNVQWVYSSVNTMKYSFSNNKFVELCKLVVNYANKTCQNI